MNNGFNQAEPDSIPGFFPHRSSPPDITLNTPLLFATLGVMVTSVAMLLSQLIQNAILASLIHVLTFLALGLALLYALYELVNQTIIARKDRRVAAHLCATLFLSSSLLGLISLAFLATASQSLALQGLGFGLTFAGLLGLLLFSTLRPPETSEMPLLQPKPLPVALPVPVGPHGSDSITNGGPGVPPGTSVPNSIPISALPTLKPPPVSDIVAIPPRPAQEFQEDPLTYMPQPKRTRFFSITKIPDNPIYNEDICVISPEEDFFVLCDGASGSSLPRSWGFYLAQQWFSKPLDQSMNVQALAQWMNDPRQNWVYWVANTWRPQTNKSNQENNIAPITTTQLNQYLLKGASATFLGLQIDTNNRQWYATAIGDTCLFQVHIEKRNLPSLIPLMPLTQSNLFTQSPPSLSSKSDNNLSLLLSSIQSKSSPYQAGDFLFMATDALAKWLIVQYERKLVDWQRFLSLSTQEQFADFITFLRQQRQIEEDDTTLVIIPL